MAQLRAIITGDMDDVGTLDPTAFALEDDVPPVPEGEVAGGDHAQPALPLRTLPAGGDRDVQGAERYLEGPAPARPPAPSTA